MICIVEEFLCEDGLYCTVNVMSEDVIAMLQNRIRKLRKEMGMTQNDLAKAAQLTQASISAIESYVHEPSLWSAYWLSRALNTTIPELFDFEGVWKKDVRDY